MRGLTLRLGVTLSCAALLISACSRRVEQPLERDTTPPPFLPSASPTPDATGGGQNQTTQQANLAHAGDIAFVSDRVAGGLQVFSIDPGSRRTTELTRGPGNHIHPAWSPDGHSIAYVRSDGDVNTANLDLYVLEDHGRTRELTAGPARDGSPAWSPDGRTIAFEHSDGGSPGLSTLSMHGGAEKPLTGHRFPTYAPAYSPDGSQIAFSRRIAGCDVPDFECEQHIWVMNADGSHLRQLTDGGEHAGEPSWSPDGSQIAYSSNDGRSNFDIWVMNADGSHQRRLTSSKGLDIGATWSPDGRSLAFASERDGNFELYLMRADGRHQRNITRSPSSDDFTPTWRSP